MILYNGQISRGAGFCINNECTDFHKDVFLLAHEGGFKCSRCHKIGRKVMEYGETDNDYSLDFWQVRLEFGYDVISDSYRSVAIVSDEEMSKEGNIYTLYSPLIKTEKRALLMAEGLLGSLLRADNSLFTKGYVPRDQVYNLDFDRPLAEITDRLNEIASVLQHSRLRKQDDGIQGS